MRETMEESGIKIKNVRFAAVTNDLFKDSNSHYITVFVAADWAEGEPKILEPDKCKEWRWVEWHDLPQPRFLPVVNLLKQGYNPFN